MPSTSVDIFTNSGSLEACRDCKSATCCGKGGSIEPPFLTTSDVERIGKQTGLEPDVYSDTIRNPHTGNTVRKLKNTSKDGCHFLSNGRCAIHHFRPVDCRLFPLDVKKIGDELQWVIYGYGNCGLSEKDYGLLMEQIPPALKVLGDELVDYATVPVPIMEEIPYRPIAPVEAY